MYYAHSGGHKLPDHLNETANIAVGMADNGVGAAFARYAGYFHDAGKFQKKFQDYLIHGGVRGSVPHAKYGAALSRTYSRVILPFVIEGHHKGLSNRCELKAILEDTLLNHEYFEVKNKFFSEKRILLPDKQNMDKAVLEHFKGNEFEFFIRYVFSLLTDADWLDTEAHYNKNAALARQKAILDLKYMMKQLEMRFLRFSKTGNINRLRNKAREQAFKNADGKTGFYSLNLPTGMGKTLISVYWALKHAEINKLKRIFIVLPYINIIDQTVKVFKEIFGHEYILEHHSGVITEEYDDENKYNPQKLAAENWDFPVIITTTVQFFESIFSNKPFKCRKNHNLADSVVIFDEVQTLPAHLIEPALEMLKNMNNVINTSFLLCTATQPAFAARDHFRGIETIVPVIEDISEIYKSVRRVEFLLMNNLEPVEIDEIVLQACIQDQSALFVLNTKKDALECFRAVLQTELFEKVYHLSTSMCARHRRLILACIKRALKQKRKIAVCATQLIEAGVDLDFPVVLRALAPLESIIQSAGRCNREGLMKKAGQVYVFQLKNGGWPGGRGNVYKTCAMYTKIFIADNPDILHDHDSYQNYYRQIISLFINPDSRNIKTARDNFLFKTVADQFKIIESPVVPVFIKDYNKKSKDIYKRIETAFKLNRSDYRQMQPYIVQVYPDFVNKHKNKLGEINGVTIWCGKYDTHEGIVYDDITVDQLIV